MRILATGTFTLSTWGHSSLPKAVYSSEPLFAPLAKGQPCLTQRLLWVLAYKNFRAHMHTVTRTCIGSHTYGYKPQLMVA